jgi:hypothetical protein
MEDVLTSEGEQDPLPLTRCRELLAEEADGLSDAQVEVIRRQVDGLAHVLVEIYLDIRHEG